MATIKDVARLAGVAPVTASRALNNPNLVNKRTLARIRDAAEQLEYRPNIAARGLRIGRAHLITLSCPQRTPYDPVLFDFASGVSQGCDPSGYSMLIDRKAENCDFGGLVQAVDGIIITDVWPQDRRIEQLKNKVPIAVFGPTHVDVPSLDLDEYQSMWLAFNHLRDLGYTKIAFVTHEGDQQYVQTRTSLYCEFMAGMGEQSMVAIGPNDFIGGYTAAGAVAADVEAMICANEVMAFGIFRYQHDHPENQMPVVSMNGGFMTDLCSPRLTAVTQPFFEAGVRVSTMLLNYIQDGTITRALLEPQLVVKESTWRKGGNRPDIRLSDIIHTGEHVV